MLHELEERTGSHRRPTTRMTKRNLAGPATVTAAAEGTAPVAATVVALTATTATVAGASERLYDVPSRIAYLLACCSISSNRFSISSKKSRLLKHSQHLILLFLFLLFSYFREISEPNTESFSRILRLTTFFKCKKEIFVENYTKENYLPGDIRYIERSICLENNSCLRHREKSCEFQGEKDKRVNRIDIRSLLES